MIVEPLISSSPPPVAFSVPGIGDIVVNLQNAAVGRLQQPGIADRVADLDGQRLDRDIGIDDAVALIFERQIAVVVANGSIAGDDVVDVVQGLASGGRDDLTAGAEQYGAAWRWCR